MDEKLELIRNLYKQYSLNDVLNSLFVIGSYPTNVASQIQHNFQYEALRSMGLNDFHSDDQILTYETFKIFCEELYKLTPGFPTYEDYCPPIDWGDTRYFYENELYTIIWGVDGSTHDQITEFRLIYSDNDEEYKKKAGRSPKAELKEILELQTSLKINVNTGVDELPEYISPGEVEVPAEEFWQDIISFNLTDFQATYPLLTDKYSVPAADLFSSKFDEKVFLKSLASGSTINAIFIDTGKKLIPILLRYSTENVIKSWKEEFTKYHLSADFFKGVNNARKDISVGLSAFQRNKFGNNKTYFLPVLLGDDGKPSEDLLVSLTFLEDRVLATLAISPSFQSKDMESELKELVPKIWTLLNKFNDSNPKFYLPVEGQICELQPKHETEFQIQMLVVLPTQFTEPQSIKLPKLENTTYMFMEDYLPIIDSCDSESDLLGFLEYLNTENILFTDIIDAFGSYKDSSSVLIAGADEPTVAFVTPTWGTSYRYGKLKEFWTLYPDLDIMDDPRGWEINQETDTRIRLVKKSMFHSLIYSKYGDTHFLQSSPFELQDYSVGSVTNLLMESLEDTFSRIAKSLEEMAVVKYSQKIEVHYFPSSFLEQDKFKHLKHLSPNGKAWSMDSGRYTKIGVGIRIVYDFDLVSKALQGAVNNTFELDLARAVLIEMDSVYPDADSLKKCLEKVDELKGKPRFTQYAVKKEASHPEHSKSLQPSDSDYKKARKLTAFTAKENDLKPGKYTSKKAQAVLNKLIKGLREKFESEIAKYSYEKSIVDLVGYIDAEIAKYRYKRLGVIGSKEHDVDYERDKLLAEAKKEFLLLHRNNRYLLEKFVSMQPNGQKKLRQGDIRYLMALADEIIGTYSASDSIHYDMYQPILVIEDDFRIGTTYPDKVLKQQDKYNRKQSQISLGTVGLESDKSKSKDVIEFANKLDISFLDDFGFKLTSMMAVQQVLSLWSEYTEDEDSESYEMPVERVERVCVEKIKDIAQEEVEKIIDFLTLKPELIIKITDDENAPVDVPVWEHTKRAYRYSIRPIMKLGDNLIWGAYAVNMSMGLWSNVIHDTELPAKLDAPSTVKVLDKEHQSLDKQLEEKCIEIGKRFTKHSQTVKPKHASFPKEYGDYDCLLYIETTNTFVNIEAKNINMPKVSKDAKRQIERVFLEKDKNYVYRVEQRGKYLSEHYQDFAKLFGVTIKDSPKVVSVFVTTDIYFWTEYPPRDTSVVFLRVDMLNDYLKEMTD